MANMIVLQNKDGIKRKAFFGFSWTVFWYGAWVPLIRRDIKRAMLFFIYTLGIAVIVLIVLMIILIILDHYYNLRDHISPIDFSNYMTTAVRKFIVPIMYYFCTFTFAKSYNKTHANFLIKKGFNEFSPDNYTNLDMIKADLGL